MKILGIPLTEVGGFFRSGVQGGFSIYESHQRKRLCEESNTTGFSRVVLEFLPRWRSLASPLDTTDFSRVERQFLPTSGHQQRPKPKPPRD